MALPATAVWEVRPTVGSDTNGGGFDSTKSGTDYSQQNSKNSSGNNISTADAASASAGTLTSATASFTSAIVGNIIYISGSGATTGWYEVTSFTNSTTVILDRSPGTGTGWTMNIGGAWASLTPWITAAVAGNTTWVKATGIYSLGTHLTLNISGGGNGQLTLIAGYTTTRGDNGQVTINCSTTLTGSACINVQTNGVVFANFLVSANGNSARGVQIGVGQSAMYNVVCTGFTDSFAFFSGNTGIMFVNCLASSCTCPGFSISGWGSLIECYAIGCQIGFSLNNAGLTNLLRCIAANNTGSTSYHGFDVQANQNSLLINDCVAYGNGGDGFRLEEAQQTVYMVQNNISYGNTGFGFNYPVAPTGMFFGINYNAYGSNGSGNLNNIPAGANDVTLSSNPFINASGGTFTLNTNVGGGAACRTAGFQGTNGGATSGSIDIGAIQSAVSGGGGSHGIISQLGWSGGFEG
jgi:hypothetical protein